MEVEVADEVEVHLFLPPCLLMEAVILGGDSTFVHRDFGNEILRACVSFFVFPKSYHS